MILRHYRLALYVFVLVLVCLCYQFPFAGSPMVAAQAGPAFVGRVRNLETERLGISHPTGLAFSPNAQSFQVIAGGREAPPATDVIQLTSYETLGELVRLAAQVEDPLNLTFDGKHNRLLILRAAGNQLLEVLARPDGTLDPHTLARYQAQHFGLQNPQGMTVDPASGVLFFLDSVGPRLVRVEPDAAGAFDNALISTVDLQPAGITQPRGLAWDPSSGHLHLFSLDQQTLFELTTSGELVNTRNVASLGLGNPQAMVFAPSGDLTDDPAEMSLYIADAGQLAQAVQAVAAEAAPESPCAAPGACPKQVYLPWVSGNADSANAEPNDEVIRAGTMSTQDAGTIVELTFVQPTAAAASSFTAALVKITDMANVATFSPPSPDPSGLTYLPNTNTLLMSDGEVEETVNGITHFQGANVWEMTLGGSIVRTANISKVAPTLTARTNEPNGVAWNPNNGHFYVTDDDARRIYDLNPGTDGLLGTADDTWTYFSTQGANNGDPEGIAYDAVHDRLFVADGVNREIYQYTTTGVFVGQFDVEQYGVLDPESVEFNRDSGTLLVLSNAGNPIIVETTTSGALLRTMNIAAANAKALAGLTYAPASDGSAGKHYYIVDRRVDNNSDPNIIDGRMSELTAPTPLPPTATDTPVPPTATATDTPVPPTATNTPVLPTATATDTPVPPTATNTPVPPTATATDTPVPPTATNTPVPPTATATNTPVLPTATNTLVPPTATATDTPVPPTATNTPVLPTATATDTPVPPTATNTPVPPTATATDTPVPPTATNTPVPPTATATDTPVPPTATNTPVPPTATATNTPVPPTATNTPVPPTATATNTPVLPTSTPEAPLFADGFEAGNLSAWSSSTTDGGHLSVSAAAALVGANGLQALINDNNAIYVTDNSPAAEPRYRARFYFDPNSIAMRNTDTHYIFYGFNATGTAVLRVELRKPSSVYGIRASLLNDGTGFTTSGWFTISDAPHQIELDWRASTAARANNGGLTLWIDGTQQTNLTGIDNDTRRIESVRLGAVAGIDSNTRGTYYFDAFESRRQTDIGP